jgi:DnaJ family protein C protein 11
MASSEESEGQFEYYSLLNVPRTATQEQIKKAYKALATVFHPDKHASDDLRDKAQEAFAKLQEAYAVLSDPQQRDIYDVCGKQGLQAGLEVGPKLGGAEDLRKRWEEFKQQQQAQREQASLSHRGYYLCKIDGSKVVRGDFSRTPPLRIVVVQNSVDIPITDEDTLFLQGQAALKDQAGSGSIIAGYRRVISPRDFLEAQVVLGLRALLSVTSTRQLGQYTSASLTTSYGLDQGLSLQVSSTRQLAARTQGVFAWVVGPAPAAGMQLSVVHRGSKYILTGKLEVGAITAVSGRVSLLVDKGTYLRLGARAGTTGMDAELGVSRQFSSTSTGYCGAAVSERTLAAKYRQLVRLGLMNAQTRCPARDGDEQMLLHVINMRIGTGIIKR